MKLDEFIKKDVLAYLESYDVDTTEENKAAADETSFLLQKDKQESKEASPQFKSVSEDEVSMDVNFFPSESSDGAYEEPSAVNMPTVDAPKEVRQLLQQRQAPQVSQAPPRQIVQQVVAHPSQQTMDRTQIRLLVEQELQSRMSQLKATMPTRQTVMQSPQRDDVLRLKNEIVDLKSIVDELQNEKQLASQERSVLKDELKRAEIEAEMAKREAKLTQEAIKSLNKKPEPSPIIPLIKFKEKEEPKPEPVSFETKPAVIEELKSVSEQKDLSQALPKPVEKKITKEIKEKTIKEEVSKPVQEKKIVSSRSQELPEVLLIEEKLHHLKEALSKKDYKIGKQLYEEIRKRAIELKEHDDEKRIIYEHLQNAANILSLALKGKITAVSKDKKQFVDTSTKPAVLIKKAEDGELTGESIEKYVNALEAMKKKEKAKSLRLLIDLADKYPTHLGIKVRLQQALAL